MRVIVPATTTNLGPGFDCLGMAFTLYNTLDVSPSDQWEVVLQPRDRGKVPEDENHLVIRTLQQVMAGLDRACPPLSLRPVNDIPITRGLGSSASCIVAALLIADALLPEPLPLPEKLRLAAGLDGHPDNVTPALVGGLTAATVDGDQVHYARTLPAEGFAFHAFVPGFELSTRQARAVLPNQVSRAHAVHNLGRTALMYASLAQGLADNLWTACQDRLHQPFRRGLIPGYGELMERMEAAGAVGAWLSGAGPTLMAVTWGDPAPFTGAMDLAVRRMDGGWRRMTLAVEPQGARSEGAL